MRWRRKRTVEVRLEQYPYTTHVLHEGDTFKLTVTANIDSGNADAVGQVTVNGGIRVVSIR